MIIVGGCSWACGEWSRGDLKDGLVHRGLSQYIEDAGIKQVNLGVPGGSNLSAAHKIDAWLSRYSQNHTVEKILIFQTDYARDMSRVHVEDFDKIVGADTLAHIMIARFYQRMIEISDRYQIPVYLIGGVSDTLPPALVESAYRPLHVACQSMTHLVIDNHADTDRPCLSWYLTPQLPMVEKIKSLLPSNKVTDLIERIDQGLERESMIFASTEWFWPDGCHPNRKAHKKLFDFLVSKGYL